PLADADCAAFEMGLEVAVGATEYDLAAENFQQTVEDNRPAGAHLEVIALDDQVGAADHDVRRVDAGDPEPAEDEPRHGAEVAGGVPADQDDRVAGLVAQGGHPGQYGDVLQDDAAPLDGALAGVGVPGPDDALPEPHRLRAAGDEKRGQVVGCGAHGWNLPASSGPTRTVAFSLVLPVIAARCDSGRVRVSMWWTSRVPSPWVMRT